MTDRHYIGGGNVAGILGASPYKTPFQEWLTITGQADEPSEERQSFFRRRKSFEPVAADLFREKSGLQLECVNERYTDSEYPFIKAELDAETTTNANVEIKTCHPLAARDWGDEGDDACPVYVTAQAMHGLMVRGRDLCYVLAMIGFDDVRLYRVERDDETIAAMRAREVAFWREHIETMIPPAPTNGADVERMFRRDAGTALEATPSLIDLVIELRMLDEQLKSSEKRHAALKDTIKLAMRDAARLTCDGRDLCTWKSQERRALDQTAFKVAQPALFEQFLRTSEIRVFRIK